MTQDPLERLAPALAWEPDWSDILRRSGERREQRAVPARRLLLAVAVAVAVLVPLAAVAAERDSWFMSQIGLPEPASEPVVVAEGTWSGHPWHVVAYRSRDRGLCWGIVADLARLSDASIGCGPFRGIPSALPGPPDDDLTLSVGVGSSTSIPLHVYGPVVGEARAVEVRFTNGETLRLTTFPAPDSVGDVAFYAARLPDGVAPPEDDRIPWMPVERVTGYGGSGEVVACYVDARVAEGTPLSDCR